MNGPRDASFFQFAFAAHIHKDKPFLILNEGFQITVGDLVNWNDIA